LLKNYNKSFTEKENNVIKKYTEIENSKAKEILYQDNNLFFMNDGFSNINKNNYPIDFEKTMYLLPDKYKNFLYQANLYKDALEFAENALNFESKTILDVGCGKGGGISFYKDFYNFKKCIGVDLTEINIDIAKTHSPDVDFYVSSATCLPIEDNSIDIITCIESIGYYDPLLKFTEEVFRVLKSDGKVIISSPCTEEKANNIENTFLQNNFILINKKDITKNVSMACAISKFRFLEFSLKEATLMYHDEQRYLDGTNTKYKTYIFVKNNNA